MEWETGWPIFTPVAALTLSGLACHFLRRSFPGMPPKCSNHYGTLAGLHRSLMFVAHIPLIHVAYNVGLGNPK